MAVQWHGCLGLLQGEFWWWGLFTLGALTVDALWLPADSLESPACAGPHHNPTTKCPTTKTWDVDIDTLDASLPHVLQGLHHQRQPNAFSPGALIYSHSSNQSCVFLGRHERQEADDVARDGRRGAHESPPNLRVGLWVKGHHDLVELTERCERLVSSDPALDDEESQYCPDIRVLSRGGKVTRQRTKLAFCLVRHSSHSSADQGANLIFVFETRSRISGGAIELRMSLYRSRSPGSVDFRKPVKASSSAAQRSRHQGGFCDVTSVNEEVLHFLWKACRHLCPEPRCRGSKLQEFQLAAISLGSASQLIMCFCQESCAKPFPTMLWQYTNSSYLSMCALQIA